MKQHYKKYLAAALSILLIGVLAYVRFKGESEPIRSTCDEVAYVHFSNIHNAYGMEAVPDSGTIRYVETGDSLCILLPKKRHGYSPGDAAGKGWFTFDFLDKERHRLGRIRMRFLTHRSTYIVNLGGKKVYIADGLVLYLLQVVKRSYNNSHEN